MPAPAVLCIHLIKSMKEVVSLRALQQWLDRFCYKHPRLGIPGLMRYIVIGNVLVYLLNLFSTNGYPVASALLSFDTSAILLLCPHPVLLLLHRLCLGAGVGEQ